MAELPRDPWTTFRDAPPSRPPVRRGASTMSGLPILAVMAIGALLTLSGLLGLLAGDRVDSFGSFGGSGLDGVYLVNLVLGIGLVMRKNSRDACTSFSR